MPDTSIPIDSDTRDRLRGEKQGNETYSDTIERVLDERQEALDMLPEVEVNDE